MFCSKCGKKLEEGMLHCPYCGTKVKAASAENVSANQKNAGGSKGKLPIIAIGAVALIVVLVVVIKLLTGGTKINAMDYAELKVDGLNTEGTAKIVFDTDALFTLIEQEKTLTERDREIIEVLVSDAHKDFALSKNSGLSNGDEVEITSNLEKKLLKEYGLIIENGSAKVTVEGLIDIAEISLADYVVLDASGFEGYGSAYSYLDWEGLRAKAEAQILAVDPSQAGKDYIDNELNWVLNSISLTPGYVEKLSNGDEVQIEISMEETAKEEYGLNFITDAAVKTVEGLMATETISVMDYVSVETEGFSGAGYAQVVFDEARLAADLQAVFEEKQRGASYEVYENMDYASEALDAADSIRYGWRNLFLTELSVEEGLKNGDVITVTSTMQEENAYVSYVGYYLEGGTTEFTVESLIEPETVKIMDYVSLQTSGYDGAGTAELIFDKEKLAADLQSAFEEKQRGAYGAAYEDIEYANEAVWAADKLHYEWRNNYLTELSAVEGLKNEDVITVTSTLQGETTFVAEIGCVMECEPVEFTVSNLEEPQEVDITEALTVEFSGVCPEVYVNRNVDYNFPYIYETSLPDFNYDIEIIARNGDVYEGEISYDEMALLKKGYVVSNNKFSYTISGLDTYELSCETLDDDLITSLNEVAYDHVQKKMSQNYKEIVDSVSEGPDWIGWDRSKITLESGKHLFKQGEYDTSSEIYLLYRGSYPVRMLDRTEVQKDIYCVALFKGVKETAAGEVLYNEWWDLNQYLTKEEAEEYIASGIQNLGENVEEKELLWEVPEAAELELVNLAEVTGEAVETKAVKAGEIQGNAANLAANVITYDGHTYARYDTQLNWQLAKQFCEAAGGHLATITSEKEAAVIELLLKDAPFGTYWLGATDEGWEGGWQWITGEAFEWTDWNDRQPDNADRSEEGAENYLETGNSYSQNWNDNYASYAEDGFILEVEPQTATDEKERMAELYQMNASAMHKSEIWKNVQDSYGDLHFYSLALNASENGVARYELNGKWTAFSGILSTYSEADSEASLHLQIWGDDQLLYSCYDYGKTDAPRAFQIDVTGVDVLSIQTNNRGAYSNGWIFIHEGKLYEAETPAAAEKVYRLGELDFIDAKGYENYLKSGMPTDFYGNSHGDWNVFEVSKGGSAMIMLDGAYTSLEASIATNPDAYDQETALGMEILADGEPLYQVDNYTIYDGLVPIAVNLTGKNILEIRTWSNQEYPSGYMFLADTAIKKAVEEVPVKMEEALAFPEIPAAVLVKAADSVTCGNYRYYRFDEPLTWQNADAFCKAAGGVLACPDTPQKNEAVKVLIADGLWKEYLLGGSNETGMWNWSNGTPFGVYTNWDDNQPDNHEEKEYLMSMYDDGRWNDLAADVKTGFVLEVKAIAGLKAEDQIALADLEWTESKSTEICNTTDEERNLQVGSIQMDASNDAFFKVQLNGQYSWFSGSISPHIQASANVDMQVAIFGDGECLYFEEHITKSDKEIAFQVDVSGVKELTVMTTNLGSYDWGLVFLKNAALELAETSELTGIARLAELVEVDMVKTDKSYEFFCDAYGNVYERSLRMNARDTASAVYNLEGKYTAFKGIITAATEHTSKAFGTSVVFLADNEEIHTIDFEKSNGAVEFEIDLTGKKVLEVRAQNLEEGKDSTVYLTEDQLF